MTLQESWALRLKQQKEGYNLCQKSYTLRSKADKLKANFKYQHGKSAKLFTRHLKMVAESEVMHAEATLLIATAEMQWIVTIEKELGEAPIHYEANGDCTVGGVETYKV